MQIYTVVLLLAAICLVATLSPNEGNDDVESLVRDFVDKFGAIITPTLDLPANHEAISQQLSVLAKLGGSIGAVLAAGLQTKSPEHVAVEKLHSTMETSFRKLSTTIKNLESKGQFADLYGPYHKDVVFRLEKLSYIYLAAIRSTPSTAVENLISACKSDKSPMQVMFFMDDYTINSCYVTKAHKKVETLRLLIAETETKLRPKSLQFKYVKEAFLAKASGLGEERLDELYKDLLKSIKTTNVSDPLTHSLEKLIPEPATYCLLRGVAVAKHYHRETVNALIEVIKDHLVKTVLMGSICASITAPKSLEQDIDFYFSKSVKVLQFLSDATPIILSGFWPDAALNKAREFIKPAKNHEEIDTDTAAIRNALELHGEVQMKYYVLASYAVEDRRAKYLVKGNEADVAVIWEEKKTRLLIRRIRENDVVNKANAIRWIKRREGNIQNILEDYQFVKAETMEEIRDQLEAKFGALNKVYTTAVLFREYQQCGPVYMDVSIRAAVVPGDVYSDLHRLAIIGNPYFGDADIALQWVGLTDWIYETQLVIPERMQKTKHKFLEFGGLDSVAEVYLDGKLIGKTDNQFRTFTFDISEVLRNNSKLEIYFKSAVKFAKRRFDKYFQKYGVDIPPTCPPTVQHGECHVNFVRKTQSSFSWDWGPSFPTAGIFGSANLISFDSFYFSHFSAVVISRDNNFLLNITTFFRCDSTAKDIEFSVELNELNVRYHENYNSACKDVSKLETLILYIPVSEHLVKLWYPRGYGSQRLYDLKVWSRSSEGYTTYNRRIGFRRIELNTENIRSDDLAGRNFALKVNSIPIFLKGSNFIPKSVFPSDFGIRKLRFLFDSAAAANMNTLRVWGGGEWASEDFLSMADQYGFLVFHDLLFACALYPTNAEFLDNIEAEILEQIHRLRNHPSVVIYSGNNELEVAIRQHWWSPSNYSLPSMESDYVKLMATALDSLRGADPSAIFVRSSPSNGFLNHSVDLVPNSELYGDIHFYDETINLWAVDKLPTPRCATEFGVPSVPSKQTILRYIPKEDWHYSSASITHRNHHRFGVATLPLMLMMHFSIRRNSTAIDMDNFAYLSQIHQAIAVRTQVEHYRRYRSRLTEDGRGNTMCALFWQLNDVWAGITWSSIDFDQRWKALHYHAVHFFAPIAVSMFVDSSNDSLRVFVVSDKLERIPAAKLRFRMMGFGLGFRPLFEITVPVDVEPLAAVEVPVISEFDLLDEPFSDQFFFRADLFAADESPLAVGFLSGDKVYDDVASGSAKITAVWPMATGRKFHIRINATDTVPFVWLDLDLSRLAERGVDVGSLRYAFSDNGFHIVEAETIVWLELWESKIFDLEAEDLTINWIYK